MKQNKHYVIILLIMSIIWGLGFPITDMAFELGFDPVHILAGRFIIASIILTAMFYKRFKVINRDYIKLTIINGIFIFLLYYTQVVGQQFTTSANTAFITQIVVIIVPFVNFFIVKEEITHKAILTAILCLVGIYFLSVFEVGFSNIAIGDYIVFLCAIFGAFNAVVASHALKVKKMDALVYTTLMFYVAAIMSIGFAFTVKTPLPEVTIKNYWPILFMGIFNTAGGFLIHSIALTKLSANVTVVIVSTEALWAAIVGVILGIDVLSIGLIIGGTLILGSTVWASIDPKTKEEASS